MKTKIVSLFLKREHLILISKMLQLNENIVEQDSQILKLDIQNQQSENKILKTERWPQLDLEYFQSNFLQISNLSFSYFKMHFPANSAVHIKDHIKFIQILKQINYGGVTIEDVFKQQRLRLQIEVLKITKFIKTVDEPIMPKIMNYKIDIQQIQSLQDRYFYLKNQDFMNPYLILNLKMPMSKTTSRPINKELYQSIASIEDIPSFQLMNSNLIQPILNYDMFKNQYEYRMNKLMQRNQQIQYTIKRYQQSFKNYEYIEDNIQDKPLKQIKKIFYSQINQIYVKKIKQVINEQNYKLDETQLDEALSQKSGQYQKEINKQSESMTYNPIQNNESLQQQMITCTNCIETSREQSPEMPNKSQKIFSLRVTPQVFIETTYQQNQSQKLLQINDQEQKNQNLIQTVLKNKNSFKSLDLQKSLILSPSSLRIPKKLLTCRKFSTLNQQNLLSSPKSNLLQDFPAQTSENLEHPNDDQNLDAHKSILTNRNLQNTCFDKIALKPIAVQQIRLKKLRDKRNEKKETTFPYVKESLPRVQEPFLFQKKNNMKTQLQNQLILLTRSEQILTSLMSNGQIRGSELYQQLLLPIKLTTCQKFLSPKSNNLISRTKFKKMQQETKMFNLK